ncbi:hypothetical protein [Chryseobacterium sp. Leaf394]|nr:hypothetical protein [Chryseobacterium sp. Leaf394]
MALLRSAVIFGMVVSTQMALRGSAMSVRVILLYGFLTNVAFITGVGVRL